MVNDGCMNTKTCTRCGEEKEANLDNFGKQKLGKLGLTARCRPCLRAIREERKEAFNANRREAYQQQKDDYKKRHKEYYANNQEYIKEWNRQFRTENKEYYREYHAKYHEEHKIRLNRKSSQWRKNNKERRKLHYHTRRSLERDLPASFTKAQWEECKKHFNQQCAYCGGEGALQQEHFVAVVNGGEYTRDNIVPACKLCNSRKNSQDFFEWYPKYKHYSETREQIILKYLGYANKTQQITLL